MLCEQIKSDNIADLYTMGKLESLKKAQFEIHLIGCQQCTDLLIETQEFRNALRAAAPAFTQSRAKAEPSRPMWLWPRAALAAALLIALLPAVFLLRDNLRLRRQLSQAENVQATLPPPVSPSISPSVSPPASPPAPDVVTDAAPSQKTERELASDHPPAPFSASPQANTPIIVLSTVRGLPAGNGESNEVAPTAAQWFVLSLELENRQFETYRATILTSEQRPYWKSNHLKPDRHDAITIGCPPGYFRAGDYLLVLEGCPPNRPPVTVATYPFHIGTKKK